jgi:hypothetical protein
MEAILYFENIFYFQISPNRVLSVAKHIGILSKSLQNWKFSFQTNLFLLQMKHKRENKK